MDGVRSWTVIPTPEQLRNQLHRVVDKPRKTCFADDCYGRLLVTKVETSRDSVSGQINYVAKTRCSRCERVVVQPSTYSAYVSARRAENSGPIRNRRY